MDTMSHIHTKKVVYSRINEVDFNALEFGKYVSDHMVICDYFDGKWHSAHIMPYANLSLAPSALALHYGQTVFEGMKAFRMEDGKANIFRLDRHYERFTRSLERMCMPVIPEHIFSESLKQLIKLDRQWIPVDEGSSLYIRPFMIATESRFGVKVSEEYRFIIFTGPVPSLYKKPIRVKVETNFIRAASGGTGFAKCGGNYGGSFYPTKLAREEGYDQVLWTDSRENNFIEESGMMNVMFVINDTLRTAPLSDTILDGITRESLLTLAKSSGINIEERAVSIPELKQSFIDGTIKEVFGAGTAAVVAPISTINISGIDYELPGYSASSVSNNLKQRIESIRTGKEPDVHGWNFTV